MKRFLMLMLVAVGTIVASATAQAATLTIGCWAANANGFQGALCVNVIFANGTFTGSLLGSPITGFWDEVSREITFIRDNSLSTSPAASQVYTGYWHPDNVNAPLGLKRMSGSFVAFQGLGGSATRHVFGWTATRFYNP